MSKRTDLLMLLADFKEHHVSELETVGGIGYRVIIQRIRKAGINVVAANNYYYIPTGYAPAIVPLHQKWLNTRRGRTPSSSSKAAKRRARAEVLAKFERQWKH